MINRLKDEQDNITEVLIGGMEGSGNLTIDHKSIPGFCASTNLSDKHRNACETLTKTDKEYRLLQKGSKNCMNGYYNQHNVEHPWDPSDLKYWDGKPTRELILSEGRGCGRPASRLACAPDRMYCTWGPPAVCCDPWHCFKFGGYSQCS